MRTSLRLALFVDCSMHYAEIGTVPFQVNSVGGLVLCWFVSLNAAALLDRCGIVAGLLSSCRHG